MKRFLACLLAVLMLTSVAFAEETTDADYEIDDLPTMVDLYLKLDTAAGEKWTFVNDSPTILDVTDEGYVETDDSPAEVSIAQTQAFRFFGLEEGFATVTFRRAAGDGEPNLIFQYSIVVDSDCNVEIYTIVAR